MPDSRQSDSGPPSLIIQSVLYGGDPGSTLRLAESVANAARIARATGQIGTWSLRLGDCSDLPVLAKSVHKTLAALCASAGGEFAYEFFGENLGHGGGHNRLARSTDSDLLLFLNPDALLGPEALVQMVLRLSDGVGVADARQIPLEHPKDYDAGSGDTNWCAGACMMTLRAAYDSIGGFDSTTFFMYCDDVDYSWRVRLAGYRAVYAPGARVFHDKRLTAEGGYQPTEAEVYFSAEAALLLAHKYSRPGRVRSLARTLRRYGTEASLRAVDEYQSRRDGGTLPAPIDPRHRVAVFLGQGYGPVRY